MYCIVNDDYLNLMYFIFASKCICDFRVKFFFEIHRSVINKKNILTEKYLFF